VGCRTVMQGAPDRRTEGEERAFRLTSPRDEGRLPQNGIREGMQDGGAIASVTEAKGEEADRSQGQDLLGDT
jgi:hypothetical protein